MRGEYIELLKSCLLDNIYGNQVVVPYTTTQKCPKTAQKKKLATKTEIEEGAYWPERAHTMIGVKRMDNIKYCVSQCIKDKIPGDLIETGVWRGGATIFMRGLLKAYNVTDRKVFVADSFEGLPKPDPKYPVDATSTYHMVEFLKISLDEVKSNFAAYNLLDDQVVFVKGFFEESLSTAPITKLAVLRLDGDMYSSTITVLEQLYDKVSPGGFIIIDDYILEGAKQAVTDFRRDRNINDPLIPIDKMSVYWRKT